MNEKLPEISEPNELVDRPTTLLGRIMQRIRQIKAEYDAPVEIWDGLTLKNPAKITHVIPRDEAKELFRRGYEKSRST